MSWQKCPICNGLGVVNSIGLHITCPTCKGERIISELTGLPPKPQEPIEPPVWPAQSVNKTV